MCQRLRSLYQRIKAKIRLTNKKLDNISSQEQETETRFVEDKKALQNFYNTSLDGDTDALLDLTETSPPITSIKSRYQEQSLLSYSPDKNSQSQNYTPKQQISHNEQSFQISPAQTQKKSRFQLKMPVKATIDPVVSKKIEKMMEKNQLNNSIDSSPINKHKSTSQPCILDSPVAANKSIVDLQSKKSFSEPLNFESGRDTWKNCKANSSKQYQENKVVEKTDYEDMGMIPQISSWSSFGKL